jgi:SH3 domain-containing YSC84-like protein 1
MYQRTLVLIALSAAALQAGESEVQRLQESTRTLNEIMAAPDKGIPTDLLAKSVCIVLIPEMKKAGFIVGAKYGRGFASCREAKGGWSAPASIRTEGGSFGLQAGVSGTDVVMLVMNKDGMKKMLQDKFTLGGDASAAGGPVGRSSSAMTDAQMHAEILTWSRSKGLFAGVSLDGSTVRPDDHANKELYGKQVKNVDILEGKVTAPASANELLAALKKYGGVYKP